MYSAIVIDNSLLSRLPIDGIKRFGIITQKKVKALQTIGRTDNMQFCDMQTGLKITSRC
jgi:hypothetical protein